MFWLSRRKTIKQYKESQAAFGNPLMGYVPSAWYNEVSEDISLLYGYHMGGAGTGRRCLQLGVN